MPKRKSITERKPKKSSDNQTREELLPTTAAQNDTGQPDQIESPSEGTTAEPAAEDPQTIDEGTVLSPSGKPIRRPKDWIVFSAALIIGLCATISGVWLYMDLGDSNYTGTRVLLALLVAIGLLFLFEATGIYLNAEIRHTWGRVAGSSAILLLFVAYIAYTEIVLFNTDQQELDDTRSELEQLTDSMRSILTHLDGMEDGLELVRLAQDLRDGGSMATFINQMLDLSTPDFSVEVYCFDSEMELNHVELGTLISDAFVFEMDGSEAGYLGIGTSPLDFTETGDRALSNYYSDSEEYGPNINVLRPRPLAGTIARELHFYRNIADDEVLANGNYRLPALQIGFGDNSDSNLETPYLTVRPVWRPRVWEIWQLLNDLPMPDSVRQHVVNPERFGSAQLGQDGNVMSIVLNLNELRQAECVQMH